ncbi:uncharacterized protein LOC129916675 [Episyrphus balteatus]|uniref:uncharacterized protein LOC129916675 n=1 Tax=Episyrphus balteatus TaxID=286459 RepID=UPI002485F6EF|nr:uncharacterized protein LOC129916675 [Episyrphus balteatus]
MTSTELKIGLTNSARPSSRVLKPPGGGHTNIFGDVDTQVNAPRPKYNQQNSSNMNACMNSEDPNKVVEKIREELTTKSAQVEKPSSEPKKSPTSDVSSSSNDSQQSKGRIPPGGFSSGGFW